VVTPVSGTVLKAFQVLDLFGEHGTLTAADCATRLGWPRSTCHRLLLTLRQAGALELNEGGHYSLSLRLFEIGAQAPLRRRLCDRAHVPLQQLTEETGMTSHLGARSGANLVFLDVVPGRAFKLTTRVGHRAPLHATSIGKLLLAHAPDNVLRNVSERGLTRFTDATIVRPDKLMRELQEIRELDVSYEHEEIHKGTSCTAVPIRLHGRVIGAISLAFPTGRPDWQRKSDELRLRKTRDVIERGLAWQSTMQWGLDERADDDTG
jgi:DNA-binding IclR family transcriptional regulator